MLIPQLQEFHLPVVDVQTKFKRAWDRLPSSYKADSALTFYHMNGRLYAYHDMGEIFAWSGNKWEKDSEWSLPEADEPSV